MTTLTAEVWQRFAVERAPWVCVRPATETAREELEMSLLFPRRNLRVSSAHIARTDEGHTLAEARVRGIGNNQQRQRAFACGADTLVRYPIRFPLTAEALGQFCEVNANNVICGRGVSAEIITHDSYHACAKLNRWRTSWSRLMLGTAGQGDGLTTHWQFVMPLRSDTKRHRVDAGRTHTLD